MTEEIPGEFADEEKWLKIFPMTAFIALGIGAGMTIMLANILRMITVALFVPGLILGAVPTIAVVVLIMVPKAETEWLKGGGQSYATLIVKKMLRRGSRCIYVLGYGRY